METIKTCFAGVATMLACKRIVQSFGENIYELSVNRKDWTPAYAEALKSRVKAIIDTHFSEEVASVHDEKHLQLHEGIMAALKDLGVFRALLKVEFKSDKSFLKNTFQQLGYNSFFSDAKNGDHVSLYQLIDAFSKNMTPDLVQKLESVHFPNELIERLKSYVDELNDLQQCYDFMSENSKLPPEAKKEINEVYAIVQDICRIAIAYYQFDPVKREQFCFYRVMIKMEEVPVGSL